jgi:hypothetical protein
MPFTPYHFGPGLFAKGLAARWFSWITFVAVQVVIDCETLYHAIRHEYPLHRTLHTFLGATLTGIAVAGLLLGCKRVLSSLLPRLRNWFQERRPSLGSEVTTAGILAGGIIGGASHPLLDGLMHPDIRPFLPWTSANPLLDAISVNTLHDVCMVTGIIGFAAVWIWLYIESRSQG